MMSLISVVFADETVKDDASDGQQNVEKAKKEETEPTQWLGKESSSKSTAQASSSSEKRNKRFFDFKFFILSNHSWPIIFLRQPNLWL